MATIAINKETFKKIRQGVLAKLEDAGLANFTQLRKTNAAGFPVSWRTLYKIMKADAENIPVSDKSLIKVLDFLDIEHAKTAVLNAK